MSRDVLNPPLQRMSNNRYYRVNLRHDDFGGDIRKSQDRRVTNSKKSYVEKDFYADDEEYDVEINGSAISELANGWLQLKMHVPSAFYGGLIGSRGATKRRLETETQTQLMVPGMNDKSTEILIKGMSRSSIYAVHRSITRIIKSLRMRLKPTHFVGIALNKGIVRQRFIEFKNELLSAKLPGIDETLFQNKNFIHLTLGVCVILDDVERNKAVELLESCREFISKEQRTFRVKVKDLEIMNDDPSSTCIVYAKIESPELQQFADRCMEPFVQSDLAATEKFTRDHVKLHMTLLNNRYALKRDVNAPTSFDAREILKRFGDFDFGEIECNEIHLCVLNAANKETESFYKITGTLKF